MSQSIDPSPDKDWKPSRAAEYDELWAREAMDRLAAYRRGEIPSIPLSEVLAKYISR